jgi:hypothetical protein
MKDIEPRFFDTENKILAHLEWEAIRVINFDGSHIDMGEAYPKYEQPQNFWMQKYFDNGSDEHHGIKSKITRKEYQSLHDFYEALKPLLKPKKKGKALKDAKHRTAQASYQREQLGDGFIEGKPELFKDARDVAKYIADMGKDEAIFTDQLAQLLFRHKALELSDTQIQTLWNFLDNQVEKHLKLDRVEAAILDEDNKNLYFMWGKIKREYPKGDTFTWTTKEAAAKCGCSRTNIAPIMKKLEKLGAITLIQPGKAGANSPRAALYRRDA